MSVAHKLIIEGPVRMVKGFVAGVLYGSGDEPEFLRWGDDEGYRTESFLEHLQEWVGLKEHLVHLVTDPKSAARILTALESNHGLPMKVRLDKGVMAGRFTFSYEVFAPIYAKKIHDIVDHPPQGVVVSGLDPEVTEHPDAKGPEMYSPDHHWAEKGTATVEGPFPAIGDFYHACADEELIRCESLLIVTSDDGSQDV